MHGSHAACNSQCGHDGRQDADEELQNELPGFLSHSGYSLSFIGYRLRCRFLVVLAAPADKRGIVATRRCDEPAVGLGLLDELVVGFLKQILKVDQMLEISHR